MSDPFQNRAPSLNGPATDIIPVTPTDVTDFSNVVVALYIEYIESGGTLSFVSQAGATRTVLVADQSILPVGTRRVNATSTTAAGILAFIVG